MDLKILRVIPVTLNAWLEPGGCVCGGRCSGKNVTQVECCRTGTKKNKVSQQDEYKQHYSVAIFWFPTIQPSHDLNRFTGFMIHF